MSRATGSAIASPVVRSCSTWSVIAETMSEVPPTRPGFSYYESHTGQPIARALVRYLAGKAD